MTNENEPEMEAQKKAQNQMKAVYEDGFAEINGVIYNFPKLNHSRRVQVFSYFSSISGQLQNNNFSFLDTPGFKKVWDAIEGLITINDIQLSKMPQHWEEHPENYMPFVITAMGVISYPFLKGLSIN